MKCWIARDGAKNGFIDHSLWLFDKKPRARVMVPENIIHWVSGGDRFAIERERLIFPEIKNGECYEAEITLGEKV